MDDVNDAARVNIVAGSSAGTEFNEDAVHTSGAAGTLSLGVRQDADTSPVSADLDYHALIFDNAGNLKVNLKTALPAGTSNIGDVDVVTLPALVAGTANIGDVDVLSIAAGDNNIGNVDIVTLPALVTSTANIGDVDVLTVPSDPFGANADAASATGSISAKLRFLAATGIAGATSLPSGANNIGDVDVLTVPADPFGVNADASSATGSISAKLRFLAAGIAGATSLPTGANNIGDVDVLTLPNVTLAVGTNTNEVVGDVAHDGVAAGNPLPIAGIAQDMDDTAPPNQVSAEGDVVRLACDRDGALFVRPFGPRIWSYHENSSSALTDASVHAAPAAGLALYVTDIVCSTGAATAMNIFFEEGASTVLGPWYLEAVAGRGLNVHLNTPKKITAATALTVTTSAAIAHSIDVTGYTAAG